MNESCTFDIYPKAVEPIDIIQGTVEHMEFVFTVDNYQKQLKKVEKYLEKH